MTIPQKTLGDYLADEDPLATVWSDLVNIVYRDSPRQAHVDRLGPSAEVLYSVGCFCGEIINGGFSQFFSNSSGNRVQESLAGLKRIGARLCVELLERALTVFPESIAPPDRQRRCGLLFTFEERNPQFLDELDQIFYKRVDALGSVSEEDVAALQLAFMKAHAADKIAAEP